MAGDWIKMRNNLWNDPRVSNICDLTGSSEAAVIGALYWLWAAADEHTESGFMPGLTVTGIDRKTGVQGFASALLSIGWLTQDADGLTISNFEEHNGSSAKKRCADAQRKANVRANADKERTSGGQERTDSGQKEPNVGAREEKRREEEIPPKAPKGARFVEFWGIWPSGDRKVARAECEKRWKARSLDEHADAILAHVEAAKRSQQWQSGYVPAPLTYLNQRRWEDAAGGEPQAVQEHFV